MTLDTRIEEQSDTVLFRVTGDGSAYWRLASLPTYEDDIWKVAGDVDGTASSVVLDPPPTGADRRLVRHEVEVDALGSIWLPVVGEPIEVETDAGVVLTAMAEAGTVMVANDVESSDGLRYRTAAMVAEPTPDQLRAAGRRSDGSVASELLDTSNAPDELLVIAREQTDGAVTDYDRALAIQDHLRGYDHSLSEPSMVSADGVERFLTERVGSAQMFASSFALMAREVGIPSRVAVGFTSGDPMIGSDGAVTYEVRGAHAHAWPELYFEGVGWVPFEPTPGRALPGAERYTGVASD